MEASQTIPSPDEQTLLPPLLACLPTSFASSKPPPAFLGLLSPILKQRLEIQTSVGDHHDSWIRLLCWDSLKTDQLKEIVENSNFEPHPSSGELEVGEVERISYKRFDTETLQAQIPLNDWDLTALYLWCTGSQEGNSWKLAELMPYDSKLSQDQSWSSSPSEANAQSGPQNQHLAVQQPNSRKSVTPGTDDDDDYWAQYDKSGNGTPARKDSVNPQAASTEADYYAQYGSVQPAMDGYDPDEHHEEIGQSTLNGGNDHSMLSRNALYQHERHDSPLRQQHNLDSLQMPNEEEELRQIEQPVPASPSSKAGSDTIARLEETADRYSASEIAIKQHISYSVKSMYRLAKGAGLTRQEFEDMMQRELETLSLLDRE